MTETLPKYSSVGSYPLFYFRAPDQKTRPGDSWDGATLCPHCVNHEAEPMEPFTEQDAHPNWEDCDLYCEHCGEIIESAYGTP